MTYGLIYRWEEPKIASGPNGAIPPRRCHTLSREVASFEPSRDGTIFFTQAARRHPAASYVAIPEDFSDWPRVVRTVARIFFQDDGYDEPSLANMTMIEAQTESGVYYQINWSLEPQVIILYSVDHLDDEIITSFVESANSNGYQAETSSIRDSLTEESIAALPSDRHDQKIVVISRTEEPEGILEFEVAGGIGGMVSGFVSIINEQGDLYFDSAISSFQLKQP